MRKILWASVFLFLFPLLAGAAPGTTTSSKVLGGFKIQKRGDELVLFGTRARVEKSESYKKVVVFAGDVDFYGKTEEFVLFGGHARFAPGSEVTKSLVVFGGSFDRENGAKVAGDRVEFKAPSFFYRLFLNLFSVAGETFQGMARWFGTLFFTLLLWGFAVVVRILFPRFFRESEERIFSQFLRNSLWAAIGILAFFPGILFLILSIIGVALVPLYISAYFATLLLAHVVLGARLGAICLRRKAGDGGVWGLLLGLMILTMVSIYVPFASWALIALNLVAWGSCLRTLRARY